jgi:hypothetical protein
VKYVSGRAQTPWGVVAAGFLLVWLPLEPAFAKPRFRASEIQGKGSEILFCDLDGDRLEDLVLIDEPNLVLFYQDARRGFARKPHQVCSLGDKPSVVWPAKVGRKAQSLLVLTVLYVLRRTSQAVSGLVILAAIMLVPNDNCPNDFNLPWIQWVGASPLMFMPNSVVLVIGYCGLHGIWPRVGIVLMAGINMCVLALVLDI